MGGKVFVTGVNGYVGAHVLDLLLKKGYSVRGSVRSQAKADQIKAKYPEYKDKLEIVLIDDIAKDGAFDKVLDDIEGIFHVASPFHYVIKNNKTDLLDPAVKGTTGILESAVKYPKIKRVIITSSFAAILDGNKDPSYVYTEEDWNPITAEQAETADPVTAYCASKKLAEKAAYDFIAERKPHFDVATINPPLVFGPIVHHVNSFEELNESARTFYEYAFGVKPVEPPGFNLYVDVRDLAEAHVLAYETKELGNNRLHTTNGVYDWQEVVDAVHKFFPGQTNTPIGNPGTHTPPRFVSSNAKSIKFGLKYHTKEETFKDSIAQLLKFKNEGFNKQSH